MAYHTHGGVNYHTRNTLFITFDDERSSVPFTEARQEQKSDPEGLLQNGWFCRWEIPGNNGVPGFCGEWLGPFESETIGVRETQQDFVESAAEPQNTEFLNDR